MDVTSATTSVVEQIYGPRTMSQSSRRCFLKVSTIAAGGAFAAGVPFATAAEAIAQTTFDTLVANQP
jgi:hypothetical protein